jgi:hypothetical protein
MFIAKERDGEGASLAYPGRYVECVLCNKVHTSPLGANRPVDSGSHKAEETCI